MLTAGGTYVEDVELARRGVAHVRALALRPRGSSRSTPTRPRPRQACSPSSPATTSPSSASSPHVNPMFPDGMRRPFVAIDVVRYVGEPVVAVVAEDRTRGADAAELVVVDYDPLPAVVEPEAAPPTRCCCSPRRARTSSCASRRRSGRLRRVRGRRRPSGSSTSA